MTTLLLDQKQNVYSEEQLSRLNRKSLPEHIAIIMDGNRRWAKREGLPFAAGHWKGAETLYSIVKASCDLGVKILTVFGFSTENWKRSSLEIKALMRVLKAHTIKQRAEMVEEGVRFHVIGDLSRFPKDVQKALKETIDATKDGDRLDLVVALNYGGRDEIKRAMQKIVDDCLSGKMEKDELSEKIISSYLDTAKWKDPDLLIRPSGESRLSNFLLWQISYSEVIFTKTYWPDFNEENLLEAIVEYQKRELRQGK